MKTLPLTAAILLSAFLAGCSGRTTRDQKESLIAGIRQTEKAFCEMAAREGIGPAFTAFADDSAVLLRGERLIKGREAIAAYYKGSDSQEVRLVWAPEFIDVSQSGDLGYTFGPYTFSTRDSTGQWIESRGIFHTVWKRQADGSWRYVWD